MTYTAEDFERAAKYLDSDDALVLAALRIAANVMRPGVIEGIMRDWHGPGEAARLNEAQLIRTALTRGE